MATKDKFSIQGYSYKNKKIFDISTFYGVDYNPAQLNVASYHATDIKNFVFEDRVLQKRKGYENLAKIPAIQYRFKDSNGVYQQYFNSTNINGVWEFTSIDNSKHIVAHIGKLLVELKNIDNFLTFEYEPIFIKDQNLIYQNVAEFELEDYKSQAFSHKGKLYILGGNNYLSLTFNGENWEIKAVEDNAYIPTTTIGICYADSPVSNITALDDVNLLTQWRKNKLVSGTYYDDGVTLRTTRYWDWALDTSVTTKNNTDLNNIRISISFLKPVEE